MASLTHFKEKLTECVLPRYKASYVLYKGTRLPMVDFSSAVCILEISITCFRFLLRSKEYLRLHLQGQIFEKWAEGALKTMYR